jgi:hypothetical protein
VEDIKRALGGNLFFKDLARVEPGKTGFQVGEVMRVYDDKGAYTVAFLRGTDERTRKQYRTKLDTAKIAYKAAPDFTL